MGERNDDDDEDVYSSLRGHEVLLKDTVRTLAYRNAIYHNKHLFKGKRVLDVGCGTGLLSMFAAKAGAARVIGIDSSEMAQHAITIIKKNKLDAIVTILQGKVEEVELPDGIEEVDVIISEWMGFSLFFQSTLDAVLFARDKWLNKSAGVLFPDVCSLYITAVEDDQFKKEKIDIWGNFRGFDLSCLAQHAFRLPSVEVVDPKKVVTNNCLLLEVDLKRLSRDEDPSFEVPFQLQVWRSTHINALVTFFTVEFSQCHKIVAFSTGPQAPTTHWKQTLFHLREEATVEKGETITGIFSLQQNDPQNTQDLDFSIKVDFEGKQSSLHESNFYRM